MAEQLWRRAQAKAGLSPLTYSCLLTHNPIPWPLNPPCAPPPQKRLANELGAEFVQQSAGIAAKRAMSESLSEALAAAFISPRASLEGRLPSFAGGGDGRGVAPTMPTIDSTGSMASLAGSGSASVGDADGVAGNGAGAEGEGKLGKSPLGP